MTTPTELREMIVEVAADLSEAEPFWTAGMLADALMEKLKPSLLDRIAQLEAELAAAYEIIADQLEIRQRLEGALKPFADTDLTTDQLGSDFAWDVLRARAALENKP